MTKSKKSLKPKQPLTYDRADQIPFYTSYGWRRLKVGELLRGTDLITAPYNSVHFGQPCIGIMQISPLTPNGGFWTVAQLEKDRIGMPLPSTTWFVCIRPWFPNRNPLLPKKDKPTNENQHQNPTKS